MGNLTHYGEDGTVRMVDVSGKAESVRRAVAEAYVRMSPQTVEAVRSKSTPKGDPLEIARIAGITAGKRTWDLIPLCHQVALSKLDVRAELVDGGVRLESEAVTTAKTGVEMEALTAVTIAALTIYDMCKAIQKDIEIGEIRLLEKSGGRADFKAESRDRDRQ